MPQRVSSLDHPTQASYDPQADALYVRLAAGRVAHTIQVDDGYSVDLDEQGRPVGIERLGVAFDARREATMARRAVA